MKQFFIVANWKSNKVSLEAKEWLSHMTNINPGEQTVIICPTFTLLPGLHSLIKQHNFPFSLGAQNISSFPEGPHTGEVSGEQIKEFAEYVLIGHSERRAVGETEEMLSAKVEQAIAARLTPIFFMQDENQQIPDGVTIVVYEPPSAISTVSGGVGIKPEDVEKVAAFLKKTYSIKYVLYGGSVSPENIVAYKHLPSIDGVVPGKASLDAQQFGQIITHA